MYLDTDWQKYYYYLGSCELFVLNDYEKAIASLRKGLSFTYKADKLNVSDLEIQLISCLGATYGYMGNRVEAERFLSLSIHYFNQLPNERSNAELTKIFLIMLISYSKIIQKKMPKFMWIKELLGPAKKIVIII